MAALWSGAAGAQNRLVNGDFETNGALVDGNNLNAPVASWTTTGTRPFNIVQARRSSRPSR